jgi:hypothetical protein
MDIAQRRHERCHFSWLPSAHPQAECHRNQCTTRDTRQPDARPSTPRPCRASLASSKSGSSGVTSVSLPPYGPYYFHSPHHSGPRIPRGFLIAPDKNNSHRLPQLPATGTRVAICGVLCPGVLPWPCPGQYAHHQALTGRDVDGSQ